VPVVDVVDPVVPAAPAEGPVYDTVTVSWVERLVTLLFVGAPVAALVYAIVRFWGEGVGLRDIVLAAVLYVVVGFGITVGYHRLLTHRSFTTTRPFKVALAVVGSLGFEGGPIGWVADHRRHHAFTDRPGDPHSPYEYGDGLRARLRGLLHAHVGWLFGTTRTPWSRYARDLLADRDIVVVDRLFPVLCVASLLIPFGIGYLLGGSIGAALTALLWAGGVRIFVLHHVTWSVNSICHWVGRRPFPTDEYSTNVAVLAVASFGESWHNGHHALPRSARHGMLPGQWDPSARLIRCMEQVGLAHDVHWPTSDQIGRARAGRPVRT
jgi:stearoyl-CoA desaturase (delta-9 desaturase)